MSVLNDLSIDHDKRVKIWRDDMSKSLSERNKMVSNVLYLHLHLHVHVHCMCFHNYLFL